ADEALKQHVKNELMKTYRRQESAYRIAVVDTPYMLRNFTGNTWNFHVPNDNDVAISDNGIVCSVTNTMIWSRNTVTNAIHGSYDLHTLTSTLGLQQEEFDPKIIFDPQANRFIAIMLNGFTDSTSNTLVGFSQTDSSWGAWNFYSLPGNPLNDTSWTDFPMASITGNELFITVNLLNNDSSWQTGFKQTIIWQIKKSEGYTGASLNPLLHYGINYSGINVRNLCPVKGGSQIYGPDMYFLSNRNFTLSNDTFFLVHINDTIYAPGQTLTVTPVLSDINYHMPVNALQPFTDSLAVNDARVLGAFTENGIIQFVFSNFDTASGKDCLFHGIADSTAGWNITGNLYVDAQRDLAYPNISYSGNSASDNRAIIVLLYSSPSIFPGTGAIAFDGTNQFSGITKIRAGTGYVNMLLGNERWGDYTGSQRRYNQNGYVWVSGQYAFSSNHRTYTWIAELFPDNVTAVPENIPSDNSALLFPNPSAGRITVAFTNPQNQFLVFEIVDAAGKLVKQLFKGAVVNGDNEFSFSTDALAAGNYLLRISGNASGNVVAKKFVKN
ncbi:MAG TPA: T9SS type A sorting domain-containing protein, partial [Bacteroidia bacterium]|nr:T9SS type A sorting domain-containing protein [Bacteroidia bacterium]